MVASAWQSDWLIWTLPVKVDSARPPSSLAGAAHHRVLHQASLQVFQATCGLVTVGTDRLSGRHDNRQTSISMFRCPLNCCEWRFMRVIFLRKLRCSAAYFYTPAHPQHLPLLSPFLPSPSLCLSPRHSVHEFMITQLDVILHAILLLNMVCGCKIECVCGGRPILSVI